MIMMQRLFIYFLILSLPVQSFAGAVMMHCAQPQAQVLAGASNRMDQHRHHSGMKMSDQSAQSQTANTTIAQADTPAGACTCAGCQDCCYHGTATFPLSSLFTVFALSIQAVPQFNNHLIAYQPSYRLDRPPRQFLV